jgi:hypothetical protein
MHFYMHSYLHKNFILVKSGCYTSSPKRARTSTPDLAPKSGSGKPRFPGCSRAYGRCPIGQPTSCHSSWHMGQRSCYPPSCSTGLPGSKPINWSRLSEHGKTPSICSKNQETSPSPDQLDTNRHSSDTTREESTPGLSR